MATQQLQSDKTTDGASSSVTLTGPCNISSKGVFDSADVSIEYSTDDSQFDPITGPEATFRRPGQFYFGGTGTYYLRSRQNNSRTSTSITIEATQ